MISNCGHDENGRYSGGKAGDQTGKEWEIRAWYNKPWEHVLYYPKKEVRDMMADDARKAAKNDNIGYDQNQRTTFWNELKKANYKPEDIKTPCESDCSEGVAALAKAAGYKLGIKELQAIPETTYTGNLLSNFKRAGFIDLTESKYLTSDAYLEPGYVLLIHNDKKSAHHAALNLDYGSKTAGKNQNDTLNTAPTGKTNEEIAQEVIAGKWGNGAARRNALEKAGYNYNEIQKLVNEKITPPTSSYRVIGIKTWLNVRKEPRIGASIVGKLYNNNIVEVQSITNGWAKIGADKYVSATYLKKV